MPTTEPLTQTIMTPSIVISEVELLCKKCNQVLTAWQNAQDAEVDNNIDCIHASSDTGFVPDDAQKGAESDAASDLVPVDWKTKLAPRDNYEDGPWIPTTELHYRRASDIHKIRKAEARARRRHGEPQADDRLHVRRPARISQGARRRMRREKEGALISKSQAERSGSCEWNAVVSHSCTEVVMDFMVRHDD